MTVCRCCTFSLGGAGPRVYRNEPDGKTWFVHSAEWCGAVVPEEHVGSEAERDYADMRRFQAKFIEADQRASRAEAALAAERESLTERFLMWRGIDGDRDQPCPACAGSGKRSYASTATWRGGIGGQAITVDVCDRCWGSGVKDKPWPSHRLTETALHQTRRLTISVAREVKEKLDRAREAIREFVRIADETQRTADERYARANKAMEAARLARDGKREEAREAIRRLDTQPTAYDFSRTVDDLTRAAAKARPLLK